MKTNQASNNLGNAGSLLPVDFGSYAAYFVRFLQAYQSHGVTIEAVTPQNEPGVAADPAMNLSEPDEATFVTRYLRPSLTAAGLSTQVYGLDTSWDMLPYAEELATGSAAGYLNGISWHCYWDSPTAMTQLHARAPWLVQLVDECSPEIRPFHTAEALIGSLRNWANAVALWNLALDPAGGPVQPPGNWCPHCRGLVTVDETTHKALLGPRYYELGQVSKFVVRGAVRIGANTFVADGTDAFSFYRPSVGLDDVAFVNPGGEKVLVTYNNSPAPIRFAVSWHGRVLLYRQPAGAMTTFIWK
jgi:glucosylceramidase